MGNPCLCFPPCWDYRHVPHTHLVFTWVLGIWTLVPILVWQVFYQLCPLLSPGDVCCFKCHTWAGEMAQWLWTLCREMEFDSRHMYSSQPFVTPVSGDLIPSSNLPERWAHEQTWFTYVHIGKTHTQIKKKSEKGHMFVIYVFSKSKWTKLGSGSRTYFECFSVYSSRQLNSFLKLPLLCNHSSHSDRWTLLWVLCAKMMGLGEGFQSRLLHVASEDQFSSGLCMLFLKQ